MPLGELAKDWLKVSFLAEETLELFLEEKADFLRILLASSIFFSLSSDF